MTLEVDRRLPADRRGMAALEFAFLAPALLSLAFGIIVYSIYFTAVIGVRQAASEGARAAVAGLSEFERGNLARLRATQVLSGYGALLGGSSQPQVVAAPDGMGVFKVTVSYDMTGSPIMRFGAFVPLPAQVITASVMVTNGGY
jgi:Flp pilus assembly protein TadG